MFTSKPKLTSTVAKMIKANKQEVNKPQIRNGQGDKNASITFFYQKNSPDMTATPSENC